MRLAIRTVLVCMLAAGLGGNAARAQQGSLLDRPTVEVAVVARRLPCLVVATLASPIGRIIHHRLLGSRCVGFNEHPIIAINRGRVQPVAVAVQNG